MDPKQLGQRIRTIREAQGMSQEQLASQISRDQRAVSLYENGQRRIFAHDIPVIAKALDVPISFLYFDGPEEDELDVQLLLEFHRLDDETRTLALQMMRLFSRAFTSRLEE